MNLGVHTAILAFLVIIETIGKIGTMPNVDHETGVVIVPQGKEGETEEEARQTDLISGAINNLERADALSDGMLRCLSCVMAR